MHPYLEHDGILAFAHRGGASDFPENSLKAFQASVALGFRYLETDVHLSTDGLIYAFHDDQLDRVTDRSGAIGALHSNEIDQARIDGTEPVPKLSDLLEAFPEHRFNIDPKSDAVVDPLGDLLEAHGALSRVCVTSFKDRRQQKMHRRFGSRVCIGLGERGIGRMLLAGWGLPVGSFCESCAQVPPRAYGIEIITPRFLTACRKRGLPVHAWVIDEPEEMQRLVGLGVDGLMTDKPQILMDFLAG